MEFHFNIDEAKKAQTTMSTDFADISFDFDGWQTEDYNFSENEDCFDEDNNNGDFAEEEEEEFDEEETLRNVPVYDSGVVHQKQNNDDNEGYVIVNYDNPQKECDTSSTASSANSVFTNDKSFYYYNESSSVATSVSDLSHDQYTSTGVKKSCLSNNRTKSFRSFCKKTVRFNAMTNIIGTSECFTKEEDSSKTLHEIFVQNKLADRTDKDQQDQEIDPEQARLDLLTQDITNMNISITRLNYTFEKLVL